MRAHGSQSYVDFAVSMARAPGDRKVLKMHFIAKPHTSNKNAP